MLHYTMLTSNRFLGKTLTVKDGEYIKDGNEFSPGSDFYYTRGAFSNVADVASQINWWNQSRKGFMITHALPRDETARRGPRLKPLFRRLPSDIGFLDLEGMPLVEGLSREDLISDPLGTIKTQLDALNPTFNELAWTFVMSSKSGVTHDFRGHFYFKLAQNYEPEAFLEWVKLVKAAGGPFDPSVYEDGHAIIVEKPRLIGMDDPFKTRAFYHHGRGLLLNIKDYSGLVRGNVMRARTANRAPSLDPVVLSGANRTDALKYYIGKMRGFAGNVGWEEVLPHLEQALREVGADASVYERFRGDVGRWKGLHLGVAQRMWETRTAADAAEVLMRPRYREPVGDVEQEHNRLRARVVDVMGGGGVHLFRASLGLGKTQAAVAAAVADSMNGEGTILAVPSHERAAEVVDRLNAELDRLAEDRWDHDQFAFTGAELRRWEAWRGREQPGMCARLPVVKAAQAAGVSVHDDVCGFPSRKDKPRCRFFDSCPYARQVTEFYQSNWVVPHAMLGHASRIASAVETVMIDESFTQNLVGTTKLDLGELLSRDKDLERVHEVLLARSKNPEVNEIELIDRKLLEDALDAERERRVPIEIDAGMDDDYMIAECERSVERYSPRIASLLRGLIAEHDRGRNHVFCYRGNSGARALVAYRKEPAFLQDKTVLMFDATPNETVLRKFFPDLEVEQFVAPNRNQIVIQVGDRTGQVSEFLTESKKATEQARVKRNRARLAQWSNAQPGKGALMLKMKVEEALREETVLRPATAHYHALEGRDVWEIEGEEVKGADLDWIALVQRSMPAAMVPEEAAMAVFCDDAEPIARRPWSGGLPWYTTERVELADGIGGLRYTHPDPRVNACFEAIWRASQAQAIGRGRGTRREKTLLVYIMHSVAVDVEVTAVIRSGMLNAMVGGVCLYGASEIERVFGYSGRFIEKVERPPSNVRYWTREGQARPCAAWAVPGVDVPWVMRAIGAVRWEMGADCAAETSG